MGTVYLIHFDRPLGHARHYVGWTEDLVERIRQHDRGNGARLMAAVTEAGIRWNVVRTWDDVDRHFERRLKRQKNTHRFCPICHEETGNNGPLPFRKRPTHHQTRRRINGKRK